MKIKTLLSLVVLAVVLVGLARWSSNRGQVASGAARIGEKVLPGLVDGINDIASVRVQSAAGTADMARVDGVWRVPGRYGYRADFAKVSDALRKLADLKIAQVMHVTPAQVAELHLLAPGPGSNTEQRATLVELKTSNGSTLASLRLGKTHNRPSPAGAPPEMGGGYPDGKYVALDDRKVYLVGDPLDELATTDRDWLDQDFLNVAATDLASIDVTGLTNGPVRVARPAAGGELVLQDIPAGKEVDSGKLTRLTGALGYLRFEDVADPGLAATVTGLDKPTVVKAATTKGVVYTLKIGASPANDARRYVNVAVSFAAPATTGVVAAASGASTNAVAEAKAKADENRKVEAGAKALNDKFSPWVFLLGDYQAASLLQPLSELVKDKVPPPAAATNAVPVETASMEVSK